MKTISDVDALLANRLEWMKKNRKNGNVGAYGPGELQLRGGDIVGRRGWTKREVDGFPGYYHDLEPDEQMHVLREHWFGVWSKEEAERAEKKRVADLKAAKAEKHKRELEFLACGVGWDWRRYTFDTYKPVTKEQREAVAACNSFPYIDEECTGAEIKNLWLLGPYGTGKTHLAIATLRRAFFDDGEDVAFVSPRQMISEIRASWNDKSLPSAREVIQRYGEVELLVLDDVRGAYGKKDGTPDQDDLYEVLDLRARNGLRTIITSNLMPKELRVAVGERNYSRLRDGARVLLLAGPDNRQAVVPDLQVKADH